MSDSHQWFCLFSEILAPQILMIWLLYNPIKNLCFFVVCFLFYFYFIQLLWLFLIEDWTETSCSVCISRSKGLLVPFQICVNFSLWTDDNLPQCWYYEMHFFLVSSVVIRFNAPNGRPLQWLYGHAPLHVINCSSSSPILPCSIPFPISTSFKITTMGCFQ